MHLIGKTLGQYRIVELICEGGMATVFKAYQPGLDRYVAIKVLSYQHARTPEFRERFFREAKAVAGLSHPNILPVYEVGIEDDLSFLAMKYVSGRCMRDIMGKPMPLQTASNLIDQIAGALDHAHQKGIIHRDVKPANVLMEENWVLLTDFGIAKIVEASTALTITGDVMGTPVYMSPEQAMGKQVDHRTDIYSLGVVIYEMITGRVPFNAETPYGIAFKHVYADLPLPREFLSDLPEAVERVILKALAKDPDHRYDQAALLASDLRESISAKLSGKTKKDVSSRKPAVNSQDKAIDSMEIGDVPEEKDRKWNWKAAVSLVSIILGVTAVAFFFYTRPVSPPPPESVPTPSAQVETGREAVRTPAAQPTVQAQIPPQEQKPAPPPESPKPAVFEDDANALYAKAMQALEVKNYADALRYLTRAGEKGHGESLNEIGYLYRRGLGVKKSNAEAAKWYRKAADLGFAVSQDNLGLMFLKGEGVEKSEEEAFKWISKAAGQGDPGGQFHLATMYRTGVGVKADEEKALEWCRKAADQGHSEAGEMYKKIQSAKLENEPGALYERATKHLDEKNYTEAMKYFTRAAEKGRPDSLNEIGYMYRRGLGVRKSDTESAKWYRKAADQGFAPAQDNLGVMFLKGEGVEKSEQEAFGWFEKAAGQGDPGGLYHLGIMYQKGVGVNANESKALDLYKKAADQGHEQAREAARNLEKGRN